MSQKSSAPTTKPPAKKLVRDIRRVTRKHHSAEDKIRIVLEGLRGEVLEGPVQPVREVALREAGAQALIAQPGGGGGEVG